jgi:hypothetical protein
MSVIPLRKRRAKKKPPLIQSDLLPRAFDGFEGNDCTHVLDVGVGVSDTLEFLAQSRCKVYFLDLAEVLSGETAAEAFGANLDAYNGVLFDVCLFWDFLHRFNGPQLTALSAALEPHIFSDTKMHSICEFGDIDATWDYRIRGIDQLEKVRGKPRSYQVWSHTRFARQFPCSRVIADQHSVGGCLEMLLQTE